MQILILYSIKIFLFVSMFIDGMSLDFRKHLLTGCLLFCGSLIAFSQNSKIAGITMVAPPDEFSINPMPPITEANAEWVAFVPYGFSKKGDTEIRYNIDWQWWGERKVGIVESIRKAHDAGLKVMLKPQIYIPGSWIGDMDFKTEEEWLNWEENYNTFIGFFIQIAIEENVEMFCLGTEVKISTQKRPEYWEELVETTKCDYHGLITYSANWDSYEEFSNWDKFDFIGISGYFPLTDEITPKVKKLVKLWKPIVKDLESFAGKHNKKILFTEYGYFTTDKCAYRAWELEKEVNNLSINQQAQANAFEGLYSAFWDQEFWAGGFIWKWFPNMKGHEGYIDKDYTPQGKLALETIKEWYGKKG